jgi:hypothetical protein
MSIFLNTESAIMYNKTLLVASIAIFASTQTFLDKQHVKQEPRVINQGTRTQQQEILMKKQLTKMQSNEHKENEKRYDFNNIQKLTCLTVKEALRTLSSSDDN